MPRVSVTSNQATPLASPNHEMPFTLANFEALQQKLISTKQEYELIINEKVDLINIQNIKMKHYDFALNEATQYLNKPLKLYSSFIEPAEETESSKASYTIETSPNRTSFEQKSATTTPIGQKPLISEPNNVTLSNLELETLEYMRIARNFLQNCTTHITKINTGEYKLPTAEFNDEIPEFPKLDSSSFDETSFEGILSPLPQLPSRLTVKKSASIASSINEILDPHSMIALPLVTGSQSEVATVNSQISEQITQLEKKNSDLVALLTKERKQRKQLLLSKQLVDKEIEDITAEVFARANQMVIDESSKWQHLNQKVRELRKELLATTDLLNDKKKQLEHSMKVIYGYETTTVVIEQMLPNENAPVTMEYAHSIVSGFDLFGSNVAGDGIIFQEFQDFMRVIILSSSQPSAEAYTSIHNTLFLKRCMVESVEPTLFYSYNRKLNMGQWMRKRFLDGSIHALVQITHSPPTTSTPTKQKCNVCQLVRECEYKLVLQDTKLETPFCCRFCRDRVLSVQDFFEFITCLAASKELQKITILSTFRRVMWLRRRMHLAVVGSCSMFEDETSAVVGTKVSTSWEQNCNIKY